MDSEFRLFPERASTMAGPVDALYFFLVGVTVVFGGLIFVLVVTFAVKYRRRPGRRLAEAVPTRLRVEFFWMFVPLAVTMLAFVWGAELFYRITDASPDAMDVYVVGRQWMWKIQHPDGRREINELHVPVGRRVRLIMTSEDVIHSFFVPAFRIKQDVLPGRYTKLWFEATRPGSFRLFCAEYCGTLHSGMVGRVVALEAREYELWLAGGRGAESPAANGERLFVRLGCAGCHAPGPGMRGPALEGIFGATVALEGGRQARADENYLRESILDPGAKVVAGFPPVMPSFRGRVGEDDLFHLLEYVKSLGRARGRGE